MSESDDSREAQPGESEGDGEHEPELGDPDGNTVRMPHPDEPEGDDDGENEPEIGDPDGDTVRMPDPATLFSDSVILSIPCRKSASPPNRPTTIAPTSSAEGEGSMAYPLCSQSDQGYRICARRRAGAGWPCRARGRPGGWRP